jgi:hypothetical protein
MSKINITKKSGQVIILNTLFFLAISFLIVLGIAGPVLNTYSISKSYLKSKQAFLLANSAAEEILYRLKTSKQLETSETLYLAGGSATINVGTVQDDKIISIDADVDNYQRNLNVQMTKGVGVSFNYGLQSGKGGFNMSGGATINGNVYSNGNIIGTGGPIITGSATAATASNPTASVVNSGPETPTHSINFGANNTPQDLAQSFSVNTNEPISSMKFYMKRSSAAWMNDITVRITTDNNNKPSKTTVATGSILHGQITTSFNYITVPFTSQPSLVTGNRYWIVFDTGTTWGSNYTLAANNNVYSYGKIMTGNWASNNGGSWSNSNPNTTDIYFEVFTGGQTGKIQGVNIGSAGGDAWAHEVSNSTIAGSLYCQAGSGNGSKVCDTSRPDPVEKPYPVSDGNIAEWKSVAEAGGIHDGNLSYGGSDVESIGPIKINGNLSVGSGATLNLNGIVWVTGNISISGGARIKLGPSYGNTSGILVTDGRISMTGGGTMQGSGQAGSYILAVTTSECPDSGNCSNKPAIEVTGGTGSVILNAQKGTIGFSGGANAKQATAHKITMSGGTRVNYETGIAEVNFSSGPSGSWNLISWDEVQ